MDRRTFLAGSLGASLVPFMNRMAFAAGKPVTWWYESAAPAQQEAIAKVLVAGFNAAHPDYSLAIDYRGSELDKQMRVALLSGNGPDVVYTAGPSYVAPMARAGQLLALDDYAEKLGWNKRILPVFLEMGKYDGKLYAVPKTYETLGLFYNKAVLEKNGLLSKGEHTDSVRQLDKTLRGKGWTPVSMAHAKPGDVVIMQRNGVSHTEIVAKNENGKITLVGSNNRNADGSQRITYDAGTWWHSKVSAILTPPR